MANLRVNFCGIEFKNPIIPASGTFGYGKEYSNFYDISKLGGISCKGLTLEVREGNPAPRIAETASGMLNCVGLQNPGIDAFISEDIPYLRQHDAVIIANIAGSTEDDYVEMAKRISAADVDMVELNISCPNVKWGGIAFGIKPEGVYNITKLVKANCTKPLVVKLSPNVSSISENAKAAEDAGADAVSLINTLTGMVVDLKNRKPLLSNVVGGLSGPAVKPVALRMIKEVYSAVKIPIMGMGGITCAKDVLEFMLCGASVVQVGTANISNPLACSQIIDDLHEYLDKENIKDINEFIGALKY